MVAGNCIVMAVEEVVIVVVGDAGSERGSFDAGSGGAVAMALLKW